jgi:UDP-N-acetylmuramate dehydrogenase
MPISDGFLTTLIELFGDRLRRDEPLSGHVTSRIGGPADIWLPVKTVDELVTAVMLARRYETPVFVLGSGANLLISDHGIRGLVIQNQASQVWFPPGDSIAGQPMQLKAASGAALPSLVRRCVTRGLSGLEWAVGVPGTIGGAVVNNAGAYGSDMATNLRRVELLSPEGKRLWHPIDWMMYGYRTSRLKRQLGGKWIVLQAELTLTTAPQAEIQARIDRYNERRKKSQPPGATMGSMFKNPTGDYAGRLIEAAGLKGYSVGQAQISTIHANFFQNVEGATATDMLTLIKKAQAAVMKNSGVQLELEIEVIGE